MAARKLIIDTDPGQDDAFAILMALGAREALEVLGITTCAGNIPLALTQRNARQVLELAGRPDIPVFAGCPRPMVKALETAERVHGDSGLDGCDLPQPTMPLQSEHAVAWMIRTLMAAAEGEITVCTLGPMTNLAVAMVMEPRIVPRIREVVLMGGGFFEGGNTTPAAEFNIYVDPHAAHTVFTSGVPLTMVPIDCTYQAKMTPEWLSELRGLGTQTAVQAAGMAEFYQRYGNEKFGVTDYCLHDPCVIGYLLAPHLFEGRDCHVAIELQSPKTIGMTIVDWWNVTKLAPNCRVLKKLDNSAFYELMLEKISCLP
ncbi:nucleoside hydrolase [Acidisoma silvae]|uniref:Nucleoside hydrolase n=1 Tax=Acidisoma silvae TaxID=2802396 RepID=A0A963YW52_9PROT|nr:nucleoside hydrolase [Acidisoma silvae]MCB8878066.1 nucleoside hydrolase [Acidisoma silvae]